MSATREGWQSIVESGEPAIADRAREYTLAVNRQREWVQSKAPVQGMNAAMETSPYIKDVLRKERAMDLKIAESLGIKVDGGNSASIAEQVVRHNGKTGQEALDLLDRFYKKHNEVIETAEARWGTQEISGRPR